MRVEGMSDEFEKLETALKEKGFSEAQLNGFYAVLILAREIAKESFGHYSKEEWKGSMNLSSESAAPFFAQLVFDSLKVLSEEVVNSNLFQNWLEKKILQIRGER
jgi:hypothetical protein